MRLWLASLAVIAAAFAASAQAAPLPGKIFKLPLPAANHAKLYLVSATLKPGVPAQDALMGVLNANMNGLPGGIRAAAATTARTSGGKTTFYVMVAINNLGGRSVLRANPVLSDLDLDLIYSATVFNDPDVTSMTCANFAILLKIQVVHYVRLGGWTSTPQQIVKYVRTKLGC